MTVTIISAFNPVGSSSFKSSSALSELSMTTLVFDKAFFGKIFNINLGGTEKSTERGREFLHLITSLLSLEIYSPTYDKVIHHVTPDRVLSVQLRGEVLLLSIKSDQKSPTTLRLEGKNLDKLVTALTPISSAAEPPRVLQAVMQVLPSMRLPVPVMPVYERLTGIIDHFFQLLEANQTATPPIIDIIACLYKARFQGGSSSLAGRELEILEQELHLKVIMHWLRAIQRAVNIPDISHDYIGRIVVNLANIIGVMAESAGINVQQLIAASIFFYDERNGAGVVSEAQKLDPVLKAKLAETRDPSMAGDLADRFYDFVIITIAARILAVYVTEIEELRNACVDRVMAEGPAQIERATEKMNAAGKGLIGDMLRRMTDRRYEPAFQYVFALWPLRDVR
jgi:hypothetical protein